MKFQAVGQYLLSNNMMRFFINFIHTRYFVYLTRIVFNLYLSLWKDGNQNILNSNTNSDKIAFDAFR